MCGPMRPVALEYVSLKGAKSLLDESDFAQTLFWCRSVPQRQPVCESSGRQDIGSRLFAIVSAALELGFLNLAAVSVMLWNNGAEPGTPNSTPPPCPFPEWLTTYAT